MQTHAGPVLATPSSLSPAELIFVGIVLLVSSTPKAPTILPPSLSWVFSSSKRRHRVKISNLCSLSICSLSDDDCTGHWSMGIAEFDESYYLDLRERSKHYLINTDSGLIILYLILLQIKIHRLKVYWANLGSITMILNLLLCTIASYICYYSYV